MMPIDKSARKKIVNVVYGQIYYDKGAKEKKRYKKET